MNFRYLFSRNVFVFLMCTFVFSDSPLMGLNVLVVGFNEGKVEDVVGQLEDGEHRVRLKHRICPHIMSAPARSDAKYSPRGGQSSDPSNGLLAKIPCFNLIYFLLDQSFSVLTPCFSFAKQAMGKTVVLHLAEGLSNTDISGVTDIMQHVDTFVVDEEIIAKVQGLLDLSDKKVLVIDNKFYLKQQNI
jgi:hypothetical protein